MSGRDMIGIAKTGSGKTLAFLLPMFRHIADQEPLEEGDGPIAVIMTPTRELCLQIGKECRKFTKAIDARAVCVYGGTGISEQIAELKRGAEIIVCTPGRMIDMLAANSGKVRLFDGAGQHSGGRISHKLKIKQFDAISSSLENFGWLVLSFLFVTYTDTVEVS